MNETAVSRAWRAAEEQAARRIARLTGLAFGTDLFVGDEEDLRGKVNCAVFSITGGGDQPQGFQSGATAWHTEGKVVAAFIERRAAQLIGAALLGGLPVTGGAAGGMENVVKVYLKNHPSVSRKLWEVANRRTRLRVAWMECTLGIVWGYNREATGADVAGA